MRHFRPWYWVPSLYFAEGIPYMVVVEGTLVLFKNLGLSNEAIATYSSYLMLPWMIKPLWSPFIDIFGRKKYWIIGMQLLMVLLLGGLGLLLRLDGGFLLIWLLLLLTAFASATHDVAADGYYLIGLNPHEQAVFTGVRSTAYRLATIAVKGGLVILVGLLFEHTGNIRFSWAAGLWMAGGSLLLLGGWHSLTISGEEDAVAGAPASTLRQVAAEFGEAVISFFRKKYVLRALLFILTYRFAEAQLTRLLTPFLLDSREVGGLGLTTGEQGLVYGTIGVIALLAGGILGGILISRQGFRFWLWPLALALNVPNIIYVFLAYAQPEALAFAIAAVAVEQFGYGLGFTVFMLFMAAFAADSGKYRTTHFALMTGFMAFGMMYPGLLAGKVFTFLGSYPLFFVYVCISTLPSFLAVGLIRKVVPAAFGRKAP